METDARRQPETSIPNAPGGQGSVATHLLNGSDAVFVARRDEDIWALYRELSDTRRGVIVVLSTSVRLMDQTAFELERSGVQAAAIHSKLDEHKLDVAESRFANGSLKVVLVSAPRFLTPSYVKIAGDQLVSTVIIDDAFEMVGDGGSGDKFGKIEKLQALLPNVRKVAVTRHLIPDPPSVIISRLDLTSPKMFYAGFERNDLVYEAALRKDPFSQALQFSERKGRSTGVFYCEYPSQVEDFVNWMKLRGEHVVPYLGSTTDDDRAGALEKLRSGAVKGLAMLAGEGLPIPERIVGFSVHMACPRSATEFLKETDVVGRPGETGGSLVVYGLGDATKHSRWVVKESNDKEWRKKALADFQSIYGVFDTAACHRKLLATSLRATRIQDCGQCENCRTPPKTIDVTKDAALALKCLSLAPGCSVVALTNILHGVPTKKHAKRKFEELNVYGTGHHLSPSEWRSIYRQLFAANYVMVDEKANLDTTPITAEVFEYETNGLCLDFREETESSAAELAQIRDGQRAETMADDYPWFNEIWGERDIMATGLGVITWRIFSEKILRVIARIKPTSVSELASIEGIAPMRAELYGPRIIQAIQRVNEGRAIHGQQDTRSIETPDDRESHDVHDDEGDET